MNVKQKVILCLLALVSVSMHAKSIDDKKSYLWNIDGGTLYQQPHLSAQIVATISYGDALQILEILPNHSVDVKVFANEDENLTTNEYLDEIVLKANWLKVTNGVEIGYMPDAFLVPLPPPEFSEDSQFINLDYLRSLSEVVARKAEKQNDAFCDRLSLEFANKMRYTYTDFGPCEQCGHSQENIFFPKLNETNGLIIALTFFRLQEFDMNKNVNLKREMAGWEIEGSLEYGQIQQMRISVQASGLLISIDYYM